MNDYIKKSIEYAFDNKLADMQDNIQAAIREKISVAIDSKKVEVAQGMFGVAESVGDDDDCGEEDEEGDLSESELKGKQKKLDKNKNGKLDAHDFKLLRKEDFSDILEMLDPSMGPEKYIHDFVHSDNPKFKGKSKKERIQMALGAYYSAKKANEESEQIDELSKDTLGSYVKKATDAKEKNWQYADAAAKRSKTAADTKQFLKHSEQFGKRTSGLKMAADRMNKEEVEEVNEISKETLGSYSKAASRKKDDATNIYKYVMNNPSNDVYNDVAELNHYGNKIQKRTQGIDRAATRLTKEDQLDELSKDTLGGYAKKAAGDLGHHAANVRQKSIGPVDLAHGGRHPKTGETPIDWDVRKTMNRKTGVNRAVDRLTKEDELDELSKDTLGNYVKKAALNQAITGMAHGREWGGEEGMKKNSEKLAKRDKGIGRAVDRLTKEDQLDELSTDTLKKYHDERKWDIPVNAQAEKKKNQGLKTAEKKLAARGEQLEGLSKDTLGNNTKKAACDLGHRAVMRKKIKR